MRKLIILSLILASFIPALAQDNVRRNIHRRCGTSMIMEREAEENGGQTRAISSAFNYMPHTGSITVPVILVNFQDVKFSINNPKTAFDQFFNGDSQTELGNGNSQNHGSVSKYFYDMSGGQYQLNFKVYGPVTLDHKETYYGGVEEDSNGDENPRLLVSDAVAKLQTSTEAITSTADISSDGNTIDCVYIVYAGLGQNDGGSGTTVWANTWSARNTYIMGKRVRWYSMAGELSPFMLTSDGRVSSRGTIPMIAGVGVTCHELSHALGFPDIYPTDTSAYVDNQEMEYWDLMDGGEYSGNGFCPTAYTAFEKNEMGWPVDIQELTENTTLSMSTSTEQGGTAYKIVNPDNSNEYFMLENIQKQGWNSEQLGNGLLVYHVNRPRGDLSTGTTFNNTPYYPGMAVVPADGLCAMSAVHPEQDFPYFGQMRGDLFPGTGNVDTLNVTELSDAKPQPNFCWYNSSRTQKLKTNKALRNISYDVNTHGVSVNYIHDVAATGIKNITTNKKNNDNRIFSIDGRYLGNDLNSLPKGIYIIGGKKILK